MDGTEPAAEDAGAGPEAKTGTKTVTPARWLLPAAGNVQETDVAGAHAPAKNWLADWTAEGRAPTWDRHVLGLRDEPAARVADGFCGTYLNEGRKKDFDPKATS